MKIGKMTDEEYKIWHKEQERKIMGRKKHKPQKRKPPKRERRELEKIAKRYFQKIKFNKMPGSFGSANK